MTESEYKQLSEFKSLPLYDDDSSLCSLIDSPQKESENGTIWIEVREATELQTAAEYLEKSELEPKGAIRYWDEERKNSQIFAYFWKRKK